MKAVVQASNGEIENRIERWFRLWNELVDSSLACHVDFVRFWTAVKHLSDTQTARISNTTINTGIYLVDTYLNGTLIYRLQSSSCVCQLTSAHVLRKSVELENKSSSSKISFFAYRWSNVTVEGETSTTILSNYKYQMNKTLPASTVYTWRNTVFSLAVNRVFYF